MEEVLTKLEKAVLRDLAEKAVFIKEGQTVGGWNRERRVALVYAAISSIYRLNKRKK